MTYQIVVDTGTASLFLGTKDGELTADRSQAISVLLPGPAQEIAHEIEQRNDVRVAVLPVAPGDVLAGIPSVHIDSRAEGLLHKFGQTPAEARLHAAISALAKGPTAKQGAAGYESGDRRPARRAA